MSKSSYAAVIGILFLVASCSTCYDCQKEVTYTTISGNDTITATDTSHVDFCTSSSIELAQKEKEYDRCVPQ